MRSPYLPQSEKQLQSELKSALILCDFRRHIMKEKGFPLIESLMFDEHDLVKRAATECMCNMVLCEEVKGCHFHVNCDSVDKSFAFERGALKSWLS